jgi:hypothetical protein
MNYFAGLFDAEGYVSLCKDGRFLIGTEIANEAVPYLFQETFKGNIYSRKRGERKKTWSWIIATNLQISLNFIDLVAPHSIVKQTQLYRLRDYLQQNRETRRSLKQDVIHQLSNLKNPIRVTKEDINVPTDIVPDNSFWEWLAGFLDGDGCLCIYEYKGHSNANKIFDSWIAVMNTFPEAISFVKHRINGCITKYKGTKFPVWRWICCQKDSQFVCESIYPFLKIKKEQCRLVMKFLEIQKTKTRTNLYTFDQINEIRCIIEQIKHLNSL